MSQFEIINNLLKSLRKEEIRSLRRFLQLFEEGSETNQLKSLALLELFLNKKEYPEAKICKKLYGDSSAASLKTFNKMLLRFKEKVYELLILDINLFRKDGHDELNMAISEVRKMLLQINVLEGKAPVQEVLKLYDKAKQVAKNYELYDELLLAMSGRINFTGQLSQSGIKSESLTEIMFYDRCRHSLLKARDIYLRLVQLKQENNSAPDKVTYEQAIDELEHEYRYTKSAAIGYILYELIFHYQQGLKNYDAAEKAMHRVITLVSENPSVYRNERMTKAFLTLANIELFRFKFKQAESTLSRALIYSKGNEAEAAAAIEISFFALFYKGQYEKAELLLSSELEKQRTASLLSIAKLSYYLATVKTVLGKTHEALLLLQNTSDLEKEQNSWNSGIRLMIILNLMEAEKLDAVESHIENFRKFLERSGKSGIVSSRNVMIVKMLARLANESFDYKHLLSKEKNNISLLESSVPEFAWQPKSPELIIFPLWIEAKAHHKKYESLAEDWFEKNKKSSFELTLFD